MVVTVATLRGRGAALDRALWDRFQRKLPAPAPAGGLVLAGIGERSIEALGGYPFPRRVHARLVRRLRAAGARAVAIDVFFEGETRPTDDRALAEAVGEAGVLLPYEASRQTRFDEEGRAVRSLQASYPPPAIRARAGGLGFANLPIDSNPDGVYRRVWLQRAGEQGELHRSLGVLLGEAVGADVESLPSGPVRLDYRPLREPGSLPVVEVIDLLAREPGALEAVRGRAVLVGAIAERLGDIKLTPVGPVPGAVIHATVAENLVSRRLVTELPAALGLGLILLGLAAVLRLPAMRWPLVGGGLLAGGILFSALLALGGIWLCPAPAVMTGGVLLLGGGLTLLVPLRRPDDRLRDHEEAREVMVEALAAGDDRAVRATWARMVPELRRDPGLVVLYARSLIPARLEGALAKVLAGLELGDQDLAPRVELAAELEEAGYLELALEEYDRLYGRDCTLEIASEGHFRLREERDRRWGVLSPRATRDLLGRDHANLRSLGEGAEGVVFAGRRRADGAAVVLKVMHPRTLEDPGALDRFRREAEALTEIQGAGVVRLLEVSRGRLPYLVLERAPGEALRTDPPPDGARRRMVLAGATQALIAVHRAGWVHRDLKPENLLVDPGGRVTLIDLGLAARVGELGPAGGTPGFVSPEQAEGRPAKPAQDVYSLGCLAATLGVEAEGPLADALAGCRDPDPDRRPTAAEVVVRLAGEG